MLIRKYLIYISSIEIYLKLLLLIRPKEALPEREEERRQLCILKFRRPGFIEKKRLGAYSCFLAETPYPGFFFLHYWGKNSPKTPPFSTPFFTKKLM